MAESSNKRTKIFRPNAAEECRICLSNFGDQPIYGDEKNPDISMEIMTFGLIQVDKLDPFTKLICVDCYRLLESAMSFQKLAKRSDKILKRRKWMKRKKTSGNAVKSETEDIKSIDFVAFSEDGNEESYGEDDSVPLSQLVANNMHVDSVTLENVTFNDTNHDNNDTQNNIIYNKQQDNISFNNVSQGIVTFLDEFQGNAAINNENNKAYNYSIEVLHDVPYHDAPNSQATKKETVDYEGLDQEVNYDKNVEHEGLVEVLEDNGHDSDTDTVMLIVADDKNKSKLDKYSCKLCNMSFPSSDEYELHRITVEHKRNYIISFLPKKKRKPGEKKETVRKPGEKKETETVFPKDKKCDICNRSFTKVHYPRHMFAQHKIKIETARSGTKKECSICKQLFHPLALNRHMKTKHCTEADPPPKVKVKCPVCHKMFSKDFYPLHMQRHEDETKNFICDQCGKKFFFKSTFYTHRLVHSNELPHKCDYCPYRGRTKGLLKTHVRTHTGDYPYKCTQCDTRCLTKSNLNAHLQRHRGPVDFICDTCNRGFYTEIQLERHIMVIHLGIKNHVCNYCGLAFGYRHGLMSHQLNVHKRAKGVGKAKAVYLKLEEQGLLAPQQQANINVAANHAKQSI